MNGDVTIRDVMRREFVGVSEADTVADAAGLMLEEGVGAVVVLRGSAPVGTVTQRDALAVALGDEAPGSVDAATAMRAEPPTVAADASLATAVDRMAGEDVRRLLVDDDGELVGVVSEHDLVTASTLDPGTNGESGAEVDRAADAQITEAVAATTDGVETTEEYSTQGICEVCGSLTRDLSTFNGQLVCRDCKNV